MSPNRSIEPSTLVGEIGAALTGIGQLVMILFPFAIPVLILTAAAAAVLALPLIALGVAAALVAGPFSRSDGYGGTSPGISSVAPRPSSLRVVQADLRTAGYDVLHPSSLQRPMKET